MARKRKKKLAFPRRQWQINPATRGKESEKKYSRATVKDEQRKLDES
jgi:hypothetical protein